MTSIQTVYDAFLAKMLEDEWGTWDEEEVNADLRMFLNAAISRFKFPRVDLTIVPANDGSNDLGEDAFADTLSQIEIEILASYMKVEWVNRSILTWENIKPLYEERDFSQANLLDKLNQLLNAEKLNALNLERIYYRSRDTKPFDYTALAGD